MSQKETKKTTTKKKSTTKKRNPDGTFAKGNDFAEKYEIKTTIIATTDGLYQPALDQALAAGGADAPDLYCAEAAFILKYAQGDAAKFAAPYADLGIDIDADIAAAEVGAFALLPGQHAFLHQCVQVDEVGVAGEGGKGLVGAVTVAGGADGQDLPVFLAGCL